VSYLKLAVGSCLSILSSVALAVDPFEDFHQYGELSDEEIHQLHAGEVLYGDIEFGFIANNGNTKSTAFKLKSNLYQDFEYWRNQFKIDSLYKEETDESTKDSDVSASRYYVSAQGNYKVGRDNESLFIFGDYNVDKFSGKAYTSTIAMGYGNRLFEGKKNTLDFDIGPGFYISKTDNDVELPTGSKRTQKGQLLRLALQWERIVSKQTRFNQDLSIEKSLSGLSSRVFSETALVSQVIGGVSLKVSYTYRYNSHPEENKEKVDTELGATLVYSF
jgi:putative salt-induced outer membrane protein YdiY